MFKNIYLIENDIIIKCKVVGVAQAEKSVIECYEKLYSNKELLIKFYYIVEKSQNIFISVPIIEDYNRNFYGFSYDKEEGPYFLNKKDAKKYLKKKRIKSKIDDDFYGDL